MVIPAWNAWEHTRACLQSLSATLDVGDQVVVVDNGSGDGTREGLMAFPWVEVVTNRENQGFARACNQGAARARGRIVIFLNSDTVVPAGWLEELLWPFHRQDVGAAGPRSDNVSGPQHVEGVPYAPDDQRTFFEFAESWRNEHHHEVTEIHRLVGFCLAIRTSLFSEVGGFDERYGIGGFEDDDLCRRVLERGLRLVVAEASMVHHHAHATFDANDVDWMVEQSKNQVYFEEKWGRSTPPAPGLLSACLIVKDEERMLPACLESLSDVVDEVVVYDTGSSDDTVRIARAAGARVVEGTWEDSFATARNAALGMATGRWVLSIDADETLLANPAAMRDQLARTPSGIEAYLVAIENLHGAGNASSVHTAIRVFERTSVTWRHRIHEQVVAADDPTRHLRTSYLSAARLVHHGYTPEVFDGRHKGERNLELARAALDDGEQSRPYALMNYGRALESVGRSEEAVDILTEAVSIAPDGITKRLATTNLVYILGRLGRYDEAIVQVGRLRQLSRSQVAADIAEGRLRLGMGQQEEGLAILARLPTRGATTTGWSTRRTWWPPSGARRSHRWSGSVRRPTWCWTRSAPTASSRWTSACSSAGCSAPVARRRRSRRRCPRRTWCPRWAGYCASHRPWPTRSSVEPGRGSRTAWSRWPRPPEWRWTCPSPGHWSGRRGCAPGGSTRRAPWSPSPGVRTWRRSCASGPEPRPSGPSVATSG